MTDWTPPQEAVDALAEALLEADDVDELWLSEARAKAAAVLTFLHENEDKGRAVMHGLGVSWRENGL